MTGVSLRARNKYSHPLDSDDFRRCYLLLQRIPEWKPRIQEMGAISTVWQSLADNWDELTTMLLQIMDGGSDGGKMYDSMKKLGC